MTFRTLLSASALAAGAAFMAFPTYGFAANATAAQIVPVAATTSPSGQQHQPRKMGFRQRVHECKAEWKADKASGKISGNETWKKYWKNCNIRLNTSQ